VNSPAPSSSFAEAAKTAPKPLPTLARVYGPIGRALWSIAGSPHRRWFLAAAFFVGLSALVVMAQLQALLAAMHLPGETAYTLRDLANPDRANVAVRTWIAHSEATTAQFSGPVLVSDLFAAIDSFVFVPAYTIVLAVAASAAFQRLPRTSADPLAHVYRALTAASFVAIPILALIDLCENGTTALIVHHEGDAGVSLRWILRLLWLGKWTLAALICLPLLVAAVAIARSPGAARPRRHLMRVFVVLRIQLAIALLFALFFLLPFSAPQNDDVIRRWVTTGWASLAVTVFFTLLLSFLLTLLSWRLLLQGRPNERTPWWAPACIGAALVCAWLVFRGLGLDGRGLAALGAILFLIGLLSYPIHVSVRSRRRGFYGWGVVPALLGAIPLIVLGLASLRAAMFELVYAGHRIFIWLVLLGIALQVLGYSAYLLAVAKAPRRLEPRPAFTKARWPLVLASCLTAFVAIAVWIDPWWVGDTLGTFGALAAFLSALALLGYFALASEQHRFAPGFFIVLGLRRFPVVTIVFVWALAAAFLDPGGYHNVRTIARTGGEPMTLDQAWQRWLTHQPDREAVPLILVASEGGGIRAAYWTARVLDCAVDADLESCGYVPLGEPGYPGAIFLASGVSGGSLGLVAYSAAQSRGGEGDWPNARLDDDFLAASGSWLLFTDLPNALLKLDLQQDRAAVLEQAWERAWEAPSPLERGLFASWQDERDVPLLILNGTSVQDGCRVNTSVLDADVEEPTRARDCLTMDAFSTAGTRPNEEALAGTHDIVDALCPDEDVRLSTAALLSARFPWVSPAGRVPRCGSGSATYVVDGGYFDTSAASTLQELWARLEPLVAEQNEAARGPCVVPVLLQLDNHYSEPRNQGATGRPWESGVPLQTVRAARDARENGARQAAALLFSRGTVAGITATVDGSPLARYAHIFPRAHPGTSAPLGWALSKTSRDDLTNQLREPANTNEFGKVRNWFSPALHCEAA
jgi:hypothetical protein